MKWIHFVLVAILVSATGAANASCAMQPKSATASTDGQPLVQVWFSDALVATGVAVGDGKQILTVLDYVGSVPYPLTAVTASGEKLETSAARFDPRTGLTVLDLVGSMLPSQALGDATARKSQTVRILGWQPVASVSESLPNSGLPSEPVLGSYEGAVSGNPYGSPERFRMNITSPAYFTSRLTPGSPVMDERGRMIGLLGNIKWGMIAPSVPPKYLQPVIGLESVTQLLSGITGHDDSADGLVGFNVARPGSVTTFLEVPPNYESVAAGLAKAVNSVGRPLAAVESADNFSKFPFAPQDGTVVVAAYARPIRLISSDGRTQADAGWVVVQWDRGLGKPDRIVYGTAEFVTQGAFELQTDISELQDAVR